MRIVSFGLLVAAVATAVVGCEQKSPSTAENMPISTGEGKGKNKKAMEAGLQWPPKQ
jgi:hypothetical protein